MKIHFVVEGEMDSGCVHNILQECVNHGKIVEVYEEDEDGRKDDLMHMAELIEKKSPC